MDSDDEEYYEEFPDDAFQSPVTRSNPLPQAPVPPPQPQPRRQSSVIQDMMNPFIGGGGFGGGAMMGHPGMAPQPRSFLKQYQAYSTAILEIKEGRGGFAGRENIMFGGNIILPPSALAQLLELSLPNPYIFELKNPYKQSIPPIHAGVIEFLAEEGTVHLPSWMMKHLSLAEGDRLRLQGTTLTPGKRILIQPQSTLFLELSDPKSVLEQALRHFPCLTPGSIIEISYNSLSFEILIKSVLPEDAEGIITLNTDLEVDFEAPPGWVEPKYERKKESIMTMREKLKIDLSSTQTVDEKGRVSNHGSNRNSPSLTGDIKGKGKENDAAATGTETPVSWEAFKGSGNTLLGKRIKGKGTTLKKIEALEPGSRIQRTDQPRIVTAETSLSGRQIPAPLKLPDGVLFFGFNAKKPTDDAGGKEEEGKKPETFEGKGNTLRGRK